LEYNVAVYQLFIDFKKANDSVRREVLYNILIEFSISMNLMRLIKMLSETYSRVRVGKNLFGKFSIRNSFKQGYAESPLLFNCALDYGIRRVQVRVYQVGFKLYGTNHLLVYAIMLKMLVTTVQTIMENAEALVVASKETGLEVNYEKTKYMVILSQDQIAGRNSV
jgi:hypothetical protein